MSYVAKDLDATTIRELLDYDEATGDFKWRSNRRNGRMGQVAGATNFYGYRRIKIDGFPYPSHRLAWIHVYGGIPSGVLIDHINGDKGDNRLCNLRLASDSQNIANSKTRRDNQSGAKGVYWASRQKRWKVQIRHEGASHHLGYFTDIEDARLAYLSAAHRLFGRFARAE